MSPKNPVDTTPQPLPADIYAGRRLRLRRAELNMTQNQLADQLGISFQQIQKYERGVNRISTSRLQQIAHILSVNTNYFFDGSIALAQKPVGFSEDEQEPLQGTPSAQESDAVEMSGARETTELVRAYYRISNPKQRRKILELIRSMEDHTDDQG